MLEFILTAAALMVVAALLGAVTDAVVKRAGWYFMRPSTIRGRLGPRSKRWARGWLLRALAWCDFEELADKGLARDLAAKVEEETLRRACASAVDSIRRLMEQTPDAILDPHGMGREYMLRLQTERAVQLSGAMDVLFQHWPAQSLDRIDLLFRYSDGMAMQGQVQKKLDPAEVAA